MRNFKLTTKATIALSALLVAVLFTGCADVAQLKECVVDSPYGFWEDYGTE